MQVVYIDVLFLINFSMDFLALRLAGALMHLPARRWPLLSAALVGGIYAVLSAFFRGSALVGAAIGILVALLLSYIAFGKECNRRAFFGVFSLFFVSSFLLGGMITAFYEFLRYFFASREELLSALSGGDEKLFFFFLVVLASSLLLRLGNRYFLFRRQERSVEITLFEGERTVRLSALADSGNTLCDPLSGKPCIVLDAEKASAVIPEDIAAFSGAEAIPVDSLTEASRRRIRLIPSDSIGGRRLLVGYLPERVAVHDPGGAPRTVDAVLVLDSRGGDRLSGYGALIPSILIP